VNDEEKEGRKFKTEEIIAELEIDTTIHQDLIDEVVDVYKMFSKKTDGETARYLTIAYMVRRMSVKDLPLNKEKKTKYVEVDKEEVKE
jgi:hypothetical protein